MVIMHLGKSTFASFIKSMLYGINKNKNGSEYSELERYKPWEDIPFSGSMEYTIDGDKYTVTREFKNNSTKVFKSNGEDISSKYNKDKSRGIDLGFEQLNIDEETFVNTVFIGQNNIQISEKSQSSIFQKLDNLIQSGDEDISFDKINNKLTKKLYDEVGTDRTTTKPKYILQKRISELEEQEENLIKSKDRHEEIISETHKLIEKRERLKEDLSKVQTTYEIKSKYEDEMSNQRTKYDIAQEEKRKIKKKNEKEIKSKKIIDTIIISVAILMLVIFLVVHKYYIYAIISVVLGVIAALLNLKIMYKDKDIIQNEEFDLMKEDIRKKESKELSKLEKEGYSKKITEKRTSELKTQIVKLKEEINECELNIHKYKIENDMLLGSLKDFSSVHEELFEKKENLQELKKEEEIINLALNVLNKSYDELRKRIIPELEKDVGYEIAKTTNNAYNQVMFNPSSGIITYNYLGTPVNISQLSQGTIDEIYIGFRLAISDRYKGVPLIFDESFAFFDEIRLKSVLKTLGEICEDRQIIILTCSKRELNSLDELSINYNTISL